jgi:hypothetical protein
MRDTKFVHKSPDTCQYIASTQGLARGHMRTKAQIQQQNPNLGFRVSGFGFRVSGFGLWVSGLGSQGMRASTSRIGQNRHPPW